MLIDYLTLSECIQPTMICFIYSCQWSLLVCIYTVRHDAQIYGHIRFFVLSVAMVTTITERSFTELSLVKAVVNPKTLVL